MAQFVSYRFNVPEAMLLASLHSIRHDLLGTLEYCAHLKAMETGNYNPILWEALSSAAVIRYARCFSPGSRQQLDHKLLKTAPEHLRAEHECFIAVRSKHVAHSVNEFEENDVTVTVCEDGASMSISGIGAQHGRVMGLDFEGPRRLVELVTWVERHVNQQITAEEKRLLLIAVEIGVERIRGFGLPGGQDGPLEGRASRSRRKP